MSAGECVFCRDLQSKRNVHQFIKDHPEWYGLIDLEQQYTVAIVTRTYQKGHKRQAARSADYRYRGYGYKLNYCPECGRLLKGASK